jgi:hypothetical protein
LKSHYYPARVGLKQLHTFNPSKYMVNEIKSVSSNKVLASFLSPLEKQIFLKIKDSSFNLNLFRDSKILKTNKTISNVLDYYLNEVSYDFNRIINSRDIGLKGDVYFCRFLLKQLGVIEDSYDDVVKNQRFSPGYKITSQGVDANVVTTLKIKGNKPLVEHDYLRLFRTTGSMVLPTRVCIRLMSTSEDITHS